MKEQDLDSLQKVPPYFKNYVLKQIDALKRGITNFDYWFIKFLQKKVPFLNFVADDKLHSLGKIILKNLSIIKTYNGMIKILEAIYGDTSIIFFLTSSTPGTLDIELEGDLSQFDKLILSDNTRLIFKDGAGIVLKGYGSLMGYSYHDFLLNFILGGVILQSIVVNGKLKNRVVVYENELLLSENGILIKKGN